MSVGFCSIENINFKTINMKYLKNNIQNIQLAGTLIGVNWYDIHDSVDRKTLHNVPAQKWLYNHIKDHFGTEILDKKIFITNNLKQ